MSVTTDAENAHDRIQSPLFRKWVESIALELTGLWLGGSLPQQTRLLSPASGSPGGPRGWTLAEEEPSLLCHQ